MVDYKLQSSASVGGTLTLTGHANFGSNLQVSGHASVLGALSYWKSDLNR